MGIGFRAFTIAIIVMGSSGMIAQIIMLRELLVTFLGNELSIGIVLANWLILEALGSFLWGRSIEGSSEKLGRYILATLAFSLTLPLSLYLCRGIKSLVGLSPGEGIGAVRMFLISLMILFPVSFSHGALFTFSCRVYADLSGSAAVSPGKVYILEVAGTALGGVAFTYGLLPFFDSFQIVLGLAALNLLVCLFLLMTSAQSKRTLTALGLACGLAFGLAGFLLLSGRVEDLHWSSVRKQWGELNVIHYENSPYGNLVVTRRGEQLDFFSDGVAIVTLPTPDIQWAEDVTHFPLLSHPRPQEVLVISGGAGGVIAEIAKHGVRLIDYVELDPLLLSLLDRYAPSAIKAEWQAPRVRVRHLDGRLYLSRTERRYDFILIGLSDPGDLQLNRFFTLEFFSLAREKLKPGGILLVNLPGSMTYLGEELKNLNACIYRTLQAVFPYVRIIPGEVNLLLGSPTPDLAGVTADLLSARLEARDLEVRLFTPFYLSYRLQERKQRWLLETLENARININRDFSPAGVFYSLSLWNARFSPRLQGLYSRSSRLKLTQVAGAVLLLMLLFLLALRCLLKRPLNLSLPFSVATTGFAGLLFDVIVVFAFQVLYGYVYHRIGLIITFFMVGTGGGSAWVTFSLAKIKHNRRMLMLLEAGIVLFSLLLAGLFLKILPAWGKAEGLSLLELPFYLISLSGGALVGAEFPLAMKIFLQPGSRFSHRVGLLNAMDLVGGWLGGIFGGVILLPVLGLARTCAVLVLLKGAALVLLGLSFPKGMKKPRSLKRY